MGATTQRDDMAERVEALSPRRLALLTGFFILALAALLFTKLQEEVASRRVETELRVSQGASECAGAMNLAIMTGDSVRMTIGKCHPGGSSAVYHVSAKGDILTSFGATEKVFLDAPIAKSLTFERRGEGLIELSATTAQAAWRPLDNGEAILVIAPAHDFYERTPIWFAYGLILAAITLVTASLMGAFLKQSRAAAEAAGAVNALRHSNDALAAGRCCAWKFDSRERTIMLSRTFLEPLGLGPRDRYFNLREITALVHPSDLRDALAIFTGDTSGVTEGIVRLREPTGAWSRIYLRTSPEATRFERIGVAFDLTGAKSVSASAAIAEARLKDAIESIPEAFVLWDANGKLAAWNKRFASIFRLPAGGAKNGMSASELSDAAKAGGDIITQYFGPDAPINEQSVEVALKGDRWIHISRRRTAEGGLVCIASNVTDMKRRARAQKKKERVLKSAVENLQLSRKDLSETMQKYEIEKYRAEEASRSKSEFLANMSHELRTPLNAINGFSEIMQSELYGPLGDEKYKEYVSDILSSGQHLLELIDDILDMSKIEAGRIQLEPARVEFERILQEAARLVAKRAKDAEVRLTVSVNHAPAVWADTRAVKQVALNLLSNAIKFTNPGGEVTLTAEADLDCVTMIVADSGAGIDQAHLEKLGAPFELVESYASRSRTGSGLGLALSRSLMDLQGGLLAIASRSGKGTVACAVFPRRPGAKVRLPQFIREEAHVLTGAPAVSASPQSSPTTTEAAE